MIDSAGGGSGMTEFDKTIAYELSQLRDNKMKIPITQLWVQCPECRKKIETHYTKYPSLHSCKCGAMWYIEFYDNSAKESRL